ncbi:MAG: putative PEP-binding protein [Anaerolineae bacterium]
MSEERRSVLIRVPGGVHARLAARIARIARAARARIWLRSARGTAEVSSPVALLQLGLSVGDQVELVAQAATASTAIKEIAVLLEVVEDIQRRWVGRSLVAGYGVGRPWWPNEYTSGELPQFADFSPETDPSWSLARSAVDEQLAQEEQSLREAGAFDLVEIISVERQLLADERLTADLGLFPSSRSLAGAEALVDLGQRLSAVLSGTDFGALTLDQDIILLGYKVMLTHLLGPASRWIRGIVTCEGGVTSHTAIAAHWLGIPMITGFTPADLEEMAEGESLNVDGHTDTVSIHLASETLPTIRRTKVKQTQVTAVTNLGLLANADTEEAVRSACDLGAVGIGLVRSEVLFLGRSAPSEEDQYRVTRSLLETAGQRSVTMRIAALHASDRLNQQSINQRGLAVILQDGESLREQFRALLRAGVDYDLRVLLPLVRTVAEWRRARDNLNSEKQLLEKILGKPIRLPIGVALEAPALLWSLDELLSKVDFFSIGSNDLSALLYAQDRDAESSLDGRVGLQPAFWRCLAGVSKAAQARGVPVIACGMLAGLWPEALLLRGLNFQLSLATDRLLPIAMDLAACTITQASQIVAEVQHCSTAEELIASLRLAGIKVKSEV